MEDDHRRGVPMYSGSYPNFTPNPEHDKALEAGRNAIISDMIGDIQRFPAHEEHMAKDAYERGKSW